MNQMLLNELSPLWILATGALIALMISALFGSKHSKLIQLSLMVSLLASLGSSLNLLFAKEDGFHALGLRFDAYTHLMTALVVSGAFFMLQAAWFERKDRPWFERDTLILTLLSSVGFGVMVAAEHLLVMYLGMELATIATYFLIHLKRDDPRVNAATIKYLLLNMVTSVFFLYGSALFYGSTGSLSLSAARACLHYPVLGSDVMLLLGLAVIITALLVKMNLVPFHFLVPEVYGSTNLPTLGFLATSYKYAVFAMLLRFTHQTLFQANELRVHVASGIEFLSILTLIWGSVLMLRTNQLQKLLAYAAIGNSGFLGLLLSCELRAGFRLSSTICYLSAYMVLFWGLLFSVVALRNGFETLAEKEKTFLGISKHFPILSFTASGFLLALAGFPPTLGFSAKWSAFHFIASASSLSLLLVPLIWSLFSLIGYVRWILPLYHKNEAALLRDEAYAAASWQGELRAFSPIFWVSLFLLFGVGMKFGLLPSGFLNHFFGVEIAVLSL